MNCLVGNTILECSKLLMYSKTLNIQSPIISTYIDNNAHIHRHRNKDDHAYYYVGLGFNDICLLKCKKFSYGKQM